MNGYLMQEAELTPGENTFVESFSSENLLDGRRVVRESPQGTRTLAYVENGKITRYEAEGSSGNSRPVFPDETVRGRGRRRL